MRMIAAVTLVLLTAIAFGPPAEAQLEARRDRLVAEMTATMEFFCLKKAGDDRSARDQCVAEQGAALREMIAMITNASDPLTRARATQLIDLCNEDVARRSGFDYVEILACVRKF